MANLLTPNLNLGIYLAIKFVEAAKFNKSTHFQIMGILNRTPDSFSDGKSYWPLSKAIDQGLNMWQEGANIIDVGGESTRPGASLVSEAEEIDRVIPLIEGLLQREAVFISIDTSKSKVMQLALDAGAKMVNDVRALRLVENWQFLSQAEVPICFSHWPSQEQSLHKQSIVSQVQAFFSNIIAKCQQNAIKPENIILDPGIGFQKTTQDNINLLKSLQDFKQFNCPLLIGLSRKRWLGDILNLSVNERLYASIAANVMALNRGASLFRVHDVKANLEALTIAAHLL